MKGDWMEPLGRIEAVLDRADYEIQRARAMLQIMRHDACKQRPQEGAESLEIKPAKIVNLLETKF